jgi:predicted nucleic acid-binding protein
MARLEPGITCEAALSEAAFLIARNGEDPVRVVDFVRRGALAVAPVMPDHAERVASLMRKYADVPMSLADACLVVLAEEHPGMSVFTLDADFLTYRRHRRQRIPLIAPFV